MGKLYLAYGSNLNMEQMAYRCPDAKYKGEVVVAGYKLTFRGRRGGGVATIEPSDNPADFVVGAIWEISKLDEMNLDVYEGFPNLYYKVDVPYEMLNGGGDGVAMAYVMHDHFPLASPSRYYLNVIREGYEHCGLEGFQLALTAKAKEVGYRE